MSKPLAPEGFGFYGGPLSNFNGGPFTVSVRVHWREADVLEPMFLVESVEHYFQAAKATTCADALLVLAERSPADAKLTGRNIRLRKDWEEIKVDVMLHAVRAKFELLDNHRKFLLATGDMFLFENSPYDAVWGLWNPRDDSWTGQNLLGKVLMQVREELR